MSEDDIIDETDDEDCDEGDCGMGPDGQCQYAGTEWCDWSCPHGGVDGWTAEARADKRAAATFNRTQAEPELPLFTTREHGRDWLLPQPIRAAPENPSSSPGV